MKILIGFFVGLLCGIVPLIFGILSKSHIFGIVGIVVTALTGIIFSLLDKSPFTAIGIAIVFVIVLFARNKRRNAQHDQDDNDIFMDDE